jgi:hypothetical protein
MTFRRPHANHPPKDVFGEDVARQPDYHGPDDDIPGAAAFGVIAAAVTALLIGSAGFTLGGHLASVHAMALCYQDDGK